MKIEFDTKLFSELKGGDAFIVSPKRNPERDRKFLSDLKVLTSEYSDMPFQDISADIFIKFDLPLRTEGNNIRVNSASLFDGHSMWFRDDLVVYPIQCMIIR